MITKDQLFVQGELIASIDEIRAAKTAPIDPLSAVLRRPLRVDEGAESDLTEREITVDRGQVPSLRSGQARDVDLHQRGIRTHLAGRHRERDLSQLGDPVEPVTALDEQTLPYTARAALARSWTGSCAVCAPSTASWRPSRASGSSTRLCTRCAPRSTSSASWAAARLFWGERAPDADGADAHPPGARSHRGVQKRLAEIEERRDALLDEIEQQERSGWFIEEDILEAQEQAERRAQEWTIEREVESFPFHTLVMPWTRGGEEDQRFRKALAALSLLALLLSLLPPLIALPLAELRSRSRCRSGMTRLIPDRPPTPPPQEIAPQQRKPEPADEARRREGDAEARRRRKRRRRRRGRRNSRLPRAVLRPRRRQAARPTRRGRAHQSRGRSRERARRSARW